MMRIEYIKGMTQARIASFIDRLARSECAADAYNEYAYGPNTNTIRRGNLSLYLHAMAERRPRSLLVMEAPGYRGCRLTGVPVTSRKLLLQGIPDLDLFGTARGFEDVPEPGFEHIQGEQSATILWGALSQLGVVPLIWNTFPFHPHQAGKALSNRRPRSAETALGMTFLASLIEWFAPAQIIAVGNVAHATLQSMDLECSKVRHPAQGGKNDFVAGLHSYLRRTI
jgi:hypothetical protein